MFKSPLHHLSVMALVEGSSLIALVLLAVPLKYAADWPTGVKIIGPPKFDVSWRRFRSEVQSWQDLRCVFSSYAVVTRHFLEH